METEYTRLLMRRRSATEWSTLNEILMDGEIGVVKSTTPRKFKIGDGVTPWNNLDFAIGSVPQGVYSGTATPAMIPAEPTGKVFYTVNKAGIYTDFGGVVLPNNSQGFITWNGSVWTIDYFTTDIAKQHEARPYGLNELTTKVIDGAEYLFRSLSDNNTNEPSLSSIATGAWTRTTQQYAPANWLDSVEWNAGSFVWGTNGVAYESKVAANLNHNPVTDISENYWKKWGVLRRNWQADVSFNLNDVVVDATDGHRIYISNTAANLEPLTNYVGAPTTWRQIGGKPVYPVFYVDENMNLISTKLDDAGVSFELNLNNELIIKIQ